MTSQTVGPRNAIIASMIRSLEQRVACMFQTILTIAGNTQSILDVVFRLSQDFRGSIASYGSVCPSQSEPFPVLSICG